MQTESKTNMIAVVAFGVLAVIAQIVIAPNIAIVGVIPHFLIVYVVFVALRLNFAKAAVLGFIIGLISSFITTAPLGLASFVLVLMALTACALRNSVFNINLALDTLVLTIILVLGELVYCVMYALFGINNDFFQSLVLFTLPSALYDIVVGFVILLILNFVQKKPQANPYRSINRKLR